jgi:hypothetical protein
MHALHVLSPSFASSHQAFGVIPQTPNSRSAHRTTLRFLCLLRRFQTATGACFADDSVDTVFVSHDAI